jgi:uncharacterized NAD(P)/FAD-binding protein YdhS
MPIHVISPASLKPGFFSSDPHECPMVVVGDGFAAATFLIHLFRLGWSPDDVLVVGDRALGRGQAYGEASDFFRLNVRADLMWIFEHDKRHFERWAFQQLDDYQASRPEGHFYRRSDYGRYVRETLDETLAGRSLRQLSDRVVDLVRVPSGWVLRTGSGTEWACQTVVLATGNPNPGWPCPITPSGDSRRIERPWHFDRFEDIPPHASVGLVGFGLTTMDILYGLVGHGHQGPVTIMASHVVPPERQADWKPGGVTLRWPARLNAATFLGTIRRFLPEDSTSSATWQSAWESMRRAFHEGWAHLDASSRRRLSKRLGWLWSRFRFRSAPQTHDALLSLQAHGRLSLRRGRVLRLDSVGGPESPSRLLLDQGSPITVDWVFNCTGPGRDPLLMSLRQLGAGSDDLDGHSLKVDRDYQVLSTGGAPLGGLYLIGPPTAAQHGDVVAASNVSQQAASLALRVVAPMVFSNESGLFWFEASSFGQDLAFIPLVVRYALNDCERRFSLKDWLGLRLPDRQSLISAAMGVVDSPGRLGSKHDVRRLQFLSELKRVLGEAADRSADPSKQAQWLTLVTAPQWPRDRLSMMLELLGHWGLDPNEAWHRLTPFHRFALDKSSTQEYWPTVLSWALGKTRAGDEVIYMN